ncbi:nuclear protein MDM1 isoform X3 [Patella vulgata]|uniref:nuclear protein MDM1 isoform X3 n=2 Tax=Patella vulgata TaxID=6465 RepID=UPI0021808323|nr:nuclear protein MDM1 isoform X3 [Patella vulgata]
MPVRFKGSSEYKENFKPFVMQPVINAASEQVAVNDAPWVGAEVGKSVEPPIQHKKRISGPPTSLANDFYERPPPQEYTLLGHNDKFASNVQYMPKKKLNMDNVNRINNNGTFIQPQPNQPVQNLDTYMEKSNQDKEIRVSKPNKPPKVDTRIYLGPPTPDTPREPVYHAETKETQTTYRQDLRNGNPKSHQPKNDSNTKPPKVDTRIYLGPPTPDTPREPVYHAETKETQTTYRQDLRNGNPKSHQPKNVFNTKETKYFQNQGVTNKQKRQANKKEKGEKNEKQVVYKAGLKDKNLKDVLDVERKPRRERWNEITQTDLDKGIIDSAPEAVSDYALRYKAGIAETRKGRKWSEYQREFEWKNRVPDSPLITADQVVHKSSTALVAPKHVPKPRASEYKSQFKAWKMRPVERKDKVEEPAEKKAKLKRSKSMGAITENVRNDEDSRSKQQVRKSLKDKSNIVDVVKASHGKLRRTESEYDSNFKAPSQFQYRDGAWHGANHPHAFISKKAEEKGEDKPSNWYGEVLELRQKADEYRKRAQGTHFSRAHLAQLLARQAELWDNTTGSTSSTLSALSLETGDLPPPKKLELKEKTLRKKGQVEQRKQRTFNDMDSTKATIATEVESTSTTDYEEPIPSNYYIGHRGKENIRPRKTAWKYTESEQTLTDDGVYDRDIETPVNEEENNNNYQEGRLPTPQLQHLDKPIQRHHFDRTTPCVGGAILSSPPEMKNRPMKKYLTKEATKIHQYANNNYSDEDEEEEARIIGKTYKLNKMKPKPTYGQPSHDTHYLLDEDASTDRPMRTQFVQTPLVEDIETDEYLHEPEEVQPRYIPKPARKKYSSPPAMEAINENFGQTYNKPIVPPLYSYQDGGYYEDDDDDDALSVSVRSVTSSCSLASEILERTRERRNNFWKSSNGVAAK